VASLLDRLDALPASRRWLVFGAAAALGAGAALAFFDPFGAPGDLSTMEPPRWNPEEDDLRAGIELEQRDPGAAVAVFREILEVMPKQLQAMHELARALDLAGQRGEARPVWEDVGRLAFYYGDEAIAGEARKRLEERP
jgi:hypothetical protein